MYQHDATTADLLDDYIDAVSSDHHIIPLGLDRTLAATVDAFHALDRHSTADPSFVATLEQRLFAQVSPPKTGHITRGTPAFRRPDRHWASPLPSNRQRWTWGALVVLLTLSLVGALNIRSDRDEPTTGIAVPLIITPAPVREVVVSRLTIQPGVTFTSPNAEWVSYIVETEPLWMSDDSPIDPIADRFYGRTGRGGMEPLTVANLGQRPATVIQRLIGVNVRGEPKVSGVEIEELGGAPIPPIPQELSTPLTESISGITDQAFFPVGVDLTFGTGSGRAALVIIERCAIRLSGLTGGSADIRRRNADGDLVPPDQAEHIEFTTNGTLELEPGDSAMLLGVAQFTALCLGPESSVLLMVPSSSWVHLDSTNGVPPHESS